MSHTAYITEQLAYNLTAHEDAPDMPECTSAATTSLTLIAESFADSLLSSDTEEVLWQIVNVFHRKSSSLERLLDSHLLKQRDLEKTQDGSEINSVSLETAMEETQKIEIRLNAIQEIRNASIAEFNAITGSSWQAKSGSVSKNKHLTASAIDSRDMRNARNLAKVTKLIPQGKRIAIAAGHCDDYNLIYNRLNKALALAKQQNENLVLLHGGSNCTVEKTVTMWANNYGIDQVIFQPDFNKHKKAAAFKRNEQIIAEMPFGLIVFGNDANNGIQQQLIRLARQQF